PAWEQGGYDLVLMDVQMPELDGLAAAAEIRARERAAGKGERVPILALTASALPEDERACLHAGMDDYLAKPISLEALERKLASLLSGCTQ
ncbi:MAG TPA: hybrid sensor histidine kinase/response regulator, partial [Planctomycetes bacterium]|nr:hybrid sensor histidine kinase/response regulator [Planctomycetota bacterium]